MSTFDEYIENPDTAALNEAEQRRMVERKAQLAAEEARLRATKSDQVPTLEMLCADMLRVAGDEATNPFWKDKILSAKRYRRFGHYPFEYVEREFGTFAHAKEVAGLADKVGTRLQKSSRAAQSRREHATRYQEENCLPYVFDPTQREPNGTELLLSISDTHAGYLDPFTWHTFLKSVQHMSPDIIVFNGDIIEGSSISRHPKVPGQVMSLQAEFDFAREMFRITRALAPDAEIVFTAGNHGLDRLAAYLTQVAPGLAGLESLKIDKLFGLDDLGIKLAQGGSFVSPKGQEKERPGVKFYDYYVCTHGTALGQTPYVSELRNVGLSGQSGHVHRAGLAYGATEALGANTWMSTPSAVVEACGRSYMKGRSIAWTRGFGEAWLHPETQRVQQQPIVTSDGFTVCGGVAYTDPGIQLPNPMDPTWLVDFHAKHWGDIK